MRYAIYYMPAPDSALWRFGSSILGIDACTGEAVARPAALGEGSGLEDIAREPARYGFHATLKAPFRLAEGCSEAELLAAAGAFAGARSTFRVPPLELAVLGRFLALVPAVATPELDRLAAACVTGFARFRAPLTETDRARRLAHPLTPRQRENVERWGYPFVMQDFAFHMTLSGPLPPEVRARALDVIAPLYAQIAAPLVIDAIAVFRQDRPQAPFRVAGRFAFAAEAATSHRQG